MASKRQRDFIKKEKAIAYIKRLSPEQLLNLANSPFQHAPLYKKQALNEVIRQNKVEIKKPDDNKYEDELIHDLDVQYELYKKGELKTFSEDEVKQKINETKGKTAINH